MTSTVWLTTSPPGHLPDHKTKSIDIDTLEGVEEWWVQRLCQQLRGHVSFGAHLAECNKQAQVKINED